MGSHIAIGGMGFICHTWKRGRLWYFIEDYIYKKLPRFWD
jgi:hypothetical protein